MRRTRFGQEKQNFSIRKYSLGAASVLIGTSLVFGLQDVKADEQVGTVASSNLPLVQVEEKSLADKPKSEPVQLTDETQKVASQIEGQVSAVETNQTSPNLTSKSQVSSETTSQEKPSSTTSQESPVQLPPVVETAQATPIATATPAAPLSLQGQYVYEKEIAVRNQPSQSAPVAFYAQVGDKVNYDKVVQAENHQWISYVSYSGTRRYVDLGQLTGSTAVNKVTEKPVEAPKVSQPTGQLTIQNQTATSFEVEVSNVTDSKGIKAIKVPVWSEQGGQNDLVWYDAVRQSNGTYKVSVSLAQHKNEQGVYHAHLYYVENDGQLVGVATTQTKVAISGASQTTQVEKIANQGTYHFTKQTAVKNEAKESAATQFTFEKGEKVNYDKKIESDGHQWISYLSYSGVRRYIDLGKISNSTSTSASQPVAPQANTPTGQLTIQNQTETGFDIEVSNVSDSHGVKAVRVPVWSEQGGQNDLVWYDAVRQSNGTYKVSVSLAQHKNEQGVYHAHLYYVENDGKMVGVATTQTKVSVASSSQVKRVEKLADQGTYHFIKQAAVKNEAKGGAITQFTFEKGEKVNYDKKIESDGHQWISYLSYSGIRRYVDLGKIETASVPLVTTQSPSPANIVEKQEGEKDTLSQSGSYTFTKTVPVKNKAENQSPTQFEFTTGDKINYDKIIESDGSRWLSYVSYSGTRRYVKISN
ncbi:YSIRK-type signal peptide-containing protein [Streptococcus suis]|nr:YSIRK-type signal peptide-containing protein [Streptococcus suis]